MNTNDLRRGAAAAQVLDCQRLTTRREIKENPALAGRGCIHLTTTLFLIHKVNFMFTKVLIYHITYKGVICFIGKFVYVYLRGII